MCQEGESYCAQSSKRMFNTIFAENFYKKLIFRQKTDVYFSRFLKKQHM